MRSFRAFVLTGLGVLSIWMVMSWPGQRQAVNQQAQPRTGCISGLSDGTPAGQAAAARIQFSLALDKTLKAQGYDLDVQIVDCIWDALYITGPDATGETLRPVVLQNGGRETLQKLGFKKLRWGPSIWNQTARIPLD